MDIKSLVVGGEDVFVLTVSKHELAQLTEAAFTSDDVSYDVFAALDDALIAARGGE